MSLLAGFTASALEELYLKACGEMAALLGGLKDFIEPRSTPVLFFGRADLARAGSIVTVGINPSGEEFRSSRPRLLHLDEEQKLSDAAKSPAWIARAVAWQRAYFTATDYEGQRIGGNPYIGSRGWFTEVEVFLKQCSASYFDSTLRLAFHLDAVTHIATESGWGADDNEPIRELLTVSIGETARGLARHLLPHAS